MLSYVNTTTINNKIYNLKKHMKKLQRFYILLQLHIHRRESSGRMDSNGELQVSANDFVRNFMLPHSIFLR